MREGGILHGGERALGRAKVKYWRVSGAQMPISVRVGSYSTDVLPSAGVPEYHSGFAWPRWAAESSAVFFLGCPALLVLGKVVHSRCRSRKEMIL